MTRTKQTRSTARNTQNNKSEKTFRIILIEGLFKANILHTMSIESFTHKMTKWLIQTKRKARSTQNNKSYQTFLYYIFLILIFFIC